MFIINNQIWYIEIVSPFNPMLYRSDGSLTIGSCDNQLKTIFISRDIPDRLFKKVLCHELTHAAMFSYNVSLDIEEEEVLADIIATYGEEIIEMTNDLFARLKRER